MEEKPEEDNKFTKQSLHILLIHEITEKLKEIKNNGYEDVEIDIDPEDKKKSDGIDKLSLAIKYGVLEKKSEGKITWEKRFFALTSKRVQYYYHLDEYRQGKVPLGLFNLKDISEIKKLNDYSHGNKKYLFMVRVTRWIKKEKPKKKRSYIFSVDNMEDLYSWLISLYYMRFNAYYETFMVSFGKMDLPLYGFENEKKKKFIFDIENKVSTVNFKHRGINKHKTIKLVLKNNQMDVNVKVYDKYLITKKLIQLCLLNLLGAIQQGISKSKDNYINNDQLLINTLNNMDNNSIVNEIKIPQHLSCFSDYRKNSFKSSEDGDNIQIISKFVSKAKRTKSLALINEDDDKDEEEEGEKDDDYSSIKDSEKLFFIKKNKKKEEGSDKQSDKTSIKLSEKNSQKVSGKILSLDKSDSEDKKDNDEKNEKTINKKEEIENEKENFIYVTDEENDIEDEDNSSEKNQKIKLTNDFRNDYSYLRYHKLSFEEDDYKSDIKSKNKIISSFNDSEDSNNDLISKDKDLDSDETKIPKFFIKEKNIRDFIDYKEQNLINDDSKNNSYE